MFKINIYLKFALIGVFFFGGIILGLIYGFGYSWILILIGLLVLATYFLLGTIQSAAEKIQLQDFDGAEKMLKLTVFPRLLYVTNRAIFYVIRGSIAMNRQRTKDAEEDFNKALSLKLPSDNETAMVLLQLANMQAMKNNWAAARIHLTKIKKLHVTENLIKQQVDQFEKAFANRGQMNVARSMGKQGMQMMKQGGAGGKRRRPKMR